VKSHVVATNGIDLHVGENGSARLSFVRLSAQSHPTCRAMVARPSQRMFPRIRKTEIWAGLVGLLDGSGIETAAMYL
jgi:hypothetical protein